VELDDQGAGVVGAEPGGGLLLGDADEYITGGAFKGLRGLFTRDQRGAVVGVDRAGRLFNRVPTAAQ
jgi:hypothetical protein